MKTIKITLLLALVAIMSTSCSKDDDAPKMSNDSIIGTWQFVSISFNGTLETNDPCDTMETLTFTNNKVKGIYYFGDNCEESDTFEQSYTLENKILTIIDPNGNMKLKILTLNATELKYENKDDGDTEITTWKRK